MHLDASTNVGATLKKKHCKKIHHTLPEVDPRPFTRRNIIAQHGHRLSREPPPISCTARLASRAHVCPLRDRGAKAHIRGHRAPLPATPAARLAHAPGPPRSWRAPRPARFNSRWPARACPSPGALLAAPRGAELWCFCSAMKPFRERSAACLVVEPAASPTRAGPVMQQQPARLGAM